MTHRIEETVARGMCIGCGACAVASNGAIPIKLTPSRMYQADLSGVNGDALRAGSRVCPFSDESPNEDVLLAPQGTADMPKDPKLGQYSRTLAGRVTDDEYIMGSSSGGMTSWLTQQLLQRGEIDAVIHVGRPGPADGEIFGYRESGEEGIAEHRKSQYYATTMAETLATLDDSSLRFAIVGIPCFIRAARALCVEKPELRSRLVYFVSIVCGHFKTQAFAESLAWQLGIPPGELDDVDFRAKNLDRGASAYDFAARSVTDSDWRKLQTTKLVGGNWGHSAFQPEACNFCDDVVGETADISFGDAWLPKYIAEPRGTNIVISRNSKLDDILADGRSSGELWTEPVTSDAAIQSQAGGFRHRREGLAVRLADDRAKGLSVPVKRVDPNAHAVPRRRARLLRHRREMAARSHLLFAEARANGNLAIYLDGMHRLIARYRRLEAPLIKRVLRRARASAQRWIRSK